MDPRRCYGDWQAIAVGNDRAASAPVPVHVAAG